MKNGYQLRDALPQHSDIINLLSFIEYTLKTVVRSIAAKMVKGTFDDGLIWAEAEVGTFYYIQYFKHLLYEQEGLAPFVSSLLSKDSFHFFLATLYFLLESFC
jgi:hypothetical protein